MATVEFPETFDAEIEVGVLVIGAGAAGLIAALRAKAAGGDVLVLERDAVPQGSTARSAGLIPAGGTRFQRGQGIIDSPARFAADVMAKAHDEPQPSRVQRVTQVLPQALEWLADGHGLDFTVVDSFTYPGHSAQRMHGLASRSGAELMDRLRGAAERAGIDIITRAHATTVFAERDGRVRGVRIIRPDGSSETLGCRRLILACNGYGGNRAIVAKAIRTMADALYFGHPGNQGDALLWGEALGADARDLAGHQGHGSVAHPHGILLTWATMTEGGFQINTNGVRFSNEAEGYSEQAARVLAQPDGAAFSIFDERIAGIARQFEDFRQLEAAGGVLRAETIPALAESLRVPADALALTFADVDGAQAGVGADAFGRIWQGIAPLVPPYCAVRVTGALFHTQGGLAVDDHARVLRKDGTPLPNLYATGGAAVGISGRHAAGYLSGNGLATAVADGYVAGQHAAVGD